MAPDSTVQLIERLVAAVTRSGVLEAEVVAVLNAARVPAAAECVTGFPGGRIGADVPVDDREGSILDQLTLIYGPPRRAIDLHGDGPVEMNWDIDGGGGEHVVLSVTLADPGPDMARTRVVSVSFTPYAMPE